jgi:HK97 family phage major capsid protein
MNQTIIKSLFNVYNLVDKKNAQDLLDKAYDHAGVEGADRLSVAEIKGMQFKAFIETKANEAMSTTQATFGGNFVNGEVLVNTILESVRDGDTLLNYVANQRTMVNPIEAIPVEWADFEMTALAENANVPGTSASLNKAGTQKLVLTAKQFAATVYFTQELMEDSVVNIMNYVERKLLQAFVTTVHNVLINGDTANVINGTTASNSALRQINGLRKIAAAGSNVIQAGELDLSDIRDARALLGIKGVDPSKLVMIMDYQSYNKILSLTQVETVEKIGLAATVVQGRLAALDGIKIVTRAEVPLTQANWVKSDTPANNVAGNIVIAHVPSLYLGWKRMLQVENDYDTTTLQYFFTGSTRLDFAVNEFDAPAVAVITNTVVSS